LYVFTYIRIYTCLFLRRLCCPLLFSFSAPSLLWFAASGSDVPFPLVCWKFPSVRTRFLRILFYVSYFLFSRFSVIVLLRGDAFRCVQQIWSNSNFESSKHSVGSGSGPASSLCSRIVSFFFFFFLFAFFVCRNFALIRNFHPRNSRFALWSWLFFCVQELPSCVLFFFCGGRWW
jgi:hypothetical protein